MNQLFEKFFKRIFFKIKSKYSNKCITLYPYNKKKIKGRVLVSYLKDSITLKKNDKIFDGHSNLWESREIAEIFRKFGFIVDIIDFTNLNFVPKEKYNIFFDIHFNLQRIAPFINRNAIKILHVTGSYPPYSIERELQRIDELENRRKCFYSPKRIIDVGYFRKSLKDADFVSLIGNKHTLSTFPKKYHKKIKFVTVSASRIDYIKGNNDFVPKKREFLWFFGLGAVHKGLDLLLEIFKKNKNLTLNIVGDLSKESDFREIYKEELFNFENIKYHGFLFPNSKKFTDIIKNVFCFVAPSCSESISTAVVTCMQLGLYPIVSVDTGITLPKKCGKYLYNLSLNEIEQAINNAYNLKPEEIKKQITKCQKYALSEFSRKNYSKTMNQFFLNILLDNKKAQKI